VNEIRALLDETIKEKAQMLVFAEAVKALDNHLTNEATGCSLEPLYRNIPNILKGYVELVYDLNNHPSVRFIEGLLYKSPLYDPSCQNIMISDKYDRAFAFSTPRLKNTGGLQLNIPFNCTSIDELSRMRHAPERLGYIQELLMVNETDMDLFSSFFTDEA